MTAAILSDPILLAELICSVLTLCYLARLAFVGEPKEEPIAPLPTVSPFQIAKNSCSRWFDVGTLIPVRKRSLCGQRL